MSNLGGQARFIRNLTENNTGQKILQNNSVYIAGNKKPIGSGERKVCRIDGTYFHEFIKSASNTNRILNNILFNRSLKKNYQNCDKIIFQSNFSKNCFQKLFLNLPQKEFVIIRNAADNEIFFPKFRKQSKIIKIISISIDYPIKRLHYFEKLTNVLIEKNIPHEIKIISGEPKVKHRLINKFKSSLKTLEQCKHISVFRNIDIHTVAKMLQSSDIYVSFSHIDPCPNAICEAVASGLPIIAPNSGGIPEIAPADNLYQKSVSKNFYFNWFDYEKINMQEINAVAKQIERVIRNWDDEIMSATEYAYSYTYNDMISKYCEFLS